MLIKLRKMMTNQKGFTLIELMVVIAIIGVLAAIAIPKFTAATDSAQDAKFKANLRTLDGTIMQYYATNAKYPDDKAALNTADYIASWPKDAKDAELNYAKSGTGYIVKGNNSKSVEKVSPGSVGFVDLDW